MADQKLEFGQLNKKKGSFLKKTSFHFCHDFTRAKT